MNYRSPADYPGAGGSEEATTVVNLAEDDPSPATHPTKGEGFKCVRRPLDHVTSRRLK